MGIENKNHTRSGVVLLSAKIETPLGPMLVIGDDAGLYMLAFMDQPDLKSAIEKLMSQLQASIIPGIANSVKLIESELTFYFRGILTEFKTPVHLLGTPFQKEVWQTLRQVPYGQTWSYAAQAQAIGKPTAFRAVANANGANMLALIVPCHRIINSNGRLGDYAGGIARKQWLLAHENRLTQD